MTLPDFKTYSWVSAINQNCNIGKRIDEWINGTKYKPSNGPM